MSEARQTQLDPEEHRGCNSREVEEDNNEKLMQAVINQCEQIAWLQRQLKRRTMIFQVDQKESLAERLGLPRDAFYDLSFVDWQHVKGENREAQIPSRLVQKKLF